MSATNAKLAREIWRWLSRHGVKSYCVCAGGRNAPLVAEAGDTPMTFGFEERATGFYALGVAKRLEGPVAVLTTSGTAVAELLPAVVEAYYAGVPLVLVTADRPRRFRGTGAPQAIEQKDLFGPYAPTIDVDRPEELPVEIRLPSGPIHLNVAFEDPLREASGTFAAPVESLEELATRSSKPLVVVGGLRPSEREHAVMLLAAFAAPVWLETTSGLRGDARLEGLALKAGAERFYRENADGLLRIGSVPTSSLWREADGVLANRPVLSLADAPWPGCSRPESTPRSLRSAAPVLSRWNDSARATFLDEDSRRAKKVVETLHAHPRSEQALVHALSGRIPASDGLYLGNSLCIRHWDRFAARRAWKHVDANRGANGIDGQLSTFFGSAPTDRPAWAVVGDLTALYDLSAPWFARGPATAPRRIVVVNNGGGQIFKELFLDERLRSAHDVHFGPWARLWRWEHHRVESPAVPLAFARRALLEIVPVPAQTEAVSRRLASEVDVP